MLFAQAVKVFVLNILLLRLMLEIYDVNLVTNVHIDVDFDPVTWDFGEIIMYLMFFCSLVVRVSKETRAAGVLENFAEGEKYSEHFLRKFVRNKAPEIMPSINSFFTDPNRS